MFYKNGDGIEQDYTKAIEYFNRCIELQGSTNAPLELAEMYFEGIFVDKDIDKGIDILTKNITKEENEKLIKYLINL